MLQACGGDDLTSEDHVRKAQELLEDSRDQYAAVKQGKETAAIAELKAALKKDRNNAQINLFLGKVYFELGAWEDAEPKLSQALDLGADAASVIPMLAQVLLGIEEFKKLESLSFDGLGPEDRSIVQAAKALAMLYREKPELAAEIMDSALQNVPLSPYAEPKCPFPH